MRCSPGMEGFRDYFHSHHHRFNIWRVAGLVVAGLVSYRIYQRLTKRKKKTYPRDVVVVHGCDRGPYCPSLSPFVVKVETFLRMNRISYEHARGIEMSSKGKIPWIEYNGEVITDSSFIIQYLNKKFKIDLDKGLTEKDKAIGRAFQKMVEENLYWCICECLVAYNYCDLSWIGYSWFLRAAMKRGHMKQSYAQGMGRHTQSEVLNIMEGDIKALSVFLGNKKFFMGSEPTEIDAAIFGMLSQIVWHSPQQPAPQWLKDKYTNLQDYCLRMKELFWKDWDDCITHGLTREATR